MRKGVLLTDFSSHISFKIIYCFLSVLKIEFSVSLKLNFKKESNCIDVMCNNDMLNLKPIVNAVNFCEQLNTQNGK